MHKAPLVTVITVTFNARAALERTIRSVANQDYPRLEYIVIDGGSTDGTLETIKENEGNITQWVSESDQGIYDAMNKGVRMAHGEYCIFMNAGDTFVTPHTVSDFFSQLYAPADVAYGDIIKNGILKPALPPRNCHKMYYCHQAVFTRTDCLRQYPFDMAHRYSADFKQSKQLFLAGKKFVHIRCLWPTSTHTECPTFTARQGFGTISAWCARPTDSPTDAAFCLTSCCLG